MEKVFNVGDRMTEEEFNSDQAAYDLIISNEAAGIPRVSIVKQREANQSEATESIETEVVDREGGAAPVVSSKKKKKKRARAMVKKSRPEEVGLSEEDTDSVVSDGESSEVLGTIEPIESARQATASIVRDMAIGDESEKVAASPTLNMSAKQKLTMDELDAVYDKMISKRKAKKKPLINDGKGILAAVEQSKKPKVKAKKPGMPFPDREDSIKEETKPIFMGRDVDDIVELAKTKTSRFKKEKSKVIARSVVNPPRKPKAERKVKVGDRIRYQSVIDRKKFFRATVIDVSAGRPKIKTKAGLVCVVKTKYTFI